MKGAEFEKHRERIKQLVYHWRKMLGLDRHTLNLTYDRSYSTHPPGVAAVTHMSRWKYLEFDITFYMPNVADCSDDQLENLVVHELVHCLLAPISHNMRGSNDEYQADLMELNTSQVAAAILTVRNISRVKMGSKT